MNKLIIIFGVSGSGKSCIGKKLSNDLNIKFIEADDFHSISNINKMKRNISLDDNDREEWLISLNNELKKELNKDEGERLSNALESMGTTFIKLGQFLYEHF